MMQGEWGGLPARAKGEVGLMSHWVSLWDSTSKERLFFCEKLDSLSRTQSWGRSASNISLSLIMLREVCVEPSKSDDSDG